MVNTELQKKWQDEEDNKSALEKAHDEGTGLTHKN